jgi:hypothetical protein
VRLVPQHVCGYINHLLQSTLAKQPVSAIPFAELEVVLHLVHIIAFDPRYREQYESFFPESLQLLIAGGMHIQSALLPCVLYRHGVETVVDWGCVDVMSHGHSTVTLEFLEVVVRYCKYLPDNHHYLAKVLSTFLDQRYVCVCVCVSLSDSERQAFSVH